MLEEKSSVFKSADAALGLGFEGSLDVIQAGDRWGGPFQRKETQSKAKEYGKEFDLN